MLPEILPEWVSRAHLTQNAWGRRFYGSSMLICNMFSMSTCLLAKGPLCWVVSPVFWVYPRPLDLWQHSKYYHTVVTKVTQEYLAIIFKKVLNGFAEGLSKGHFGVCNIPSERSLQEHYSCRFSVINI